MKQAHAIARMSRNGREETKAATKGVPIERAQSTPSMWRFIPLPPVPPLQHLRHLYQKDKHDLLETVRNIIVGLSAVKFQITNYQLQISSLVSQCLYLVQVGGFSGGVDDGDQTDHS